MWVVLEKENYIPTIKCVRMLFTYRKKCEISLDYMHKLKTRIVEQAPHGYMIFAYLNRRVIRKIVNSSCPDVLMCDTGILIIQLLSRV